MIIEILKVYVWVYKPLLASFPSREFASKVDVIASSEVPRLGSIINDTLVCSLNNEKYNHGIFEIALKLVQIM